MKYQPTGPARTTRILNWNQNVQGEIFRSTAE